MNNILHFPCSKYLTFRSYVTVTFYSYWSFCIRLLKHFFPTCCPAFSLINQVDVPVLFCSPGRLFWFAGPPFSYAKLCKFWMSLLKLSRVCKWKILETFIQLLYIFFFSIKIFRDLCILNWLVWQINKEILLTCKKNYAKMASLEVCLH